MYIKVKIRQPLDLLRSTQVHLRLSLLSQLIGGVSDSNLFVAEHKNLVGSQNLVFVIYRLQSLILRVKV